MLIDKLPNFRTPARKRMLRASLCATAIFLLMGADGGEGCAPGGPAEPEPVVCGPEAHLELVCEENCDEPMCEEKCVPNDPCGPEMHPELICAPPPEPPPGPPCEGPDCEEPPPPPELLPEPCEGPDCEPPPPPPPPPEFCEEVCVPNHECGPEMHPELICFPPPPPPPPCDDPNGCPPPPPCEGPDCEPPPPPPCDDPEQCPPPPEEICEEVCVPNFHCGPGAHPELICDPPPPHKCGEPEGPPPEGPPPEDACFPVCVPNIPCEPGMHEEWICEPPPPHDCGAPKEGPPPENCFPACVPNPCPPDAEPMVVCNEKDCWEECLPVEELPQEPPPQPR